MVLCAFGIIFLVGGLLGGTGASEAQSARQAIATGDYEENLLRLGGATYRWTAPSEDPRRKAALAFGIDRLEYVSDSLKWAGYSDWDIEAELGKRYPLARSYASSRAYYEERAGLLRLILSYAALAIALAASFLFFASLWWWFGARASKG